MTAGEFYTTQFYAWEYRGRGWHLADEPVQLEPPFMPFFRHGFHQRQIDDGKRHTILSGLLESLKGPSPPIRIGDPALDYSELELFPYENHLPHRAIQLSFPKERRIDGERMKAFLLALSNSDALVSFEIIGTETSIIVQFVCQAPYSAIIASYFKAYFPQATILETDDGIDPTIMGLPTAVVDLGLQEECVYPLHMPKSFSLDPHIPLIAVLDSLRHGERAGIQVLFQPAVNAWSESMVRAVTLWDGSSFFVDVPDAPKYASEKTKSPLYGVVIRIFAQAMEYDEAFQLLSKVGMSVQYGTKSPLNQLIPLYSEPYDFETRMIDIQFRESHRLGMLLNLDELVGLVHYPSEAVSSKKLSATTRKTKETPAIAKGKTYTLGTNPHVGKEEPVTISTEDRMKHTHIIGATGTGKSTLIANLIKQDIEQGAGVVLFDPHGDLVDDVIALIPEHRLKDVVLIDPSDIDYPVGINILQAETDMEKEVLASDLVASFQRYATSWGDQMSTVLGNAILALLEHEKTYSLHDLRRFLLEKDFRENIVRSVKDPSIAYYWQKEYPLQKSSSIGSILTRLDTFLRPKSIRNMVVQQKGVDFGKLFNGNAIILCKLSQGMIGKENSYLLGSLLLSTIHQAILRRQTQQHRTPVFLYLDEFHNFITPSIKEMISGVRKYHVGLTLSHQDLQQVQREDAELLNGVLGNCMTRVIFRVGEPDAKKLQEGLHTFTHEDLQNLGRGEAVVRIEQPQYDCSIDTLPLPMISAEEKTQKHAIVQANTRATYAMPKEEVEAMLMESFTITDPTPQKHEKKVPQQPVRQEPEKQQEVSHPVERQPPQPEPVAQEPAKDISQHRYLQTLIKKMAESKGYKATIEAAIPAGDGNVDVLLEKDGTTIACEISITTTKHWEVHNIKKCLAAGYDTVVVISSEQKHLFAIEEIVRRDIAEAAHEKIQLFSPEALFRFLDAHNLSQAEPEPEVIKGYRVNVSYEAGTRTEETKKRKSVAEIVSQAMRRMKKKE